MYIDDLIGSDVSVNKAALRATANNALMRACGIAMRLSGFMQKHLGNGIDGANDLAAAKQAAVDRAAALNSAGRDSMPLELVMHRLMALYLSLATRLQDEDWHKPMDLDAALTLLSNEREWDNVSDAEYIAALAKVYNETEESLRARQAKQSAKDAERNRELAPIAKTLLEECGDTGEPEDMIFQDLPINVQFGIFCKAVDQAANQLDRDKDRSMRFVGSKSSVLRSLAISEGAAGQDALNQLEKQLTAFIAEHRSELDL